MNRTILTGILILATGVSGAMAKDKKDKDKDKDKAQPPAAAAAAAPAQKGPTPKSDDERKAVQTLFMAAGKPDETIAAAENLLTKFADTDFKDTALYMEAEAYRQKGDKEKLQLYAERALAANPQHYQASLMLSEVIVQQTREHDLDRDEKLAKANKYANDSITALNAASKPNPNLPDPQWEEIKKDLLAEAHDALGMSALQAKKYDAAITEFKMAVDGAVHPEPAYQIRLASAYQGAGKNDEAIALAEKVMNDPTNPAQIKSVAQAVRAAAVVAKKGSAGPATGTAPPAQIEIKKP